MAYETYWRTIHDKLLIFVTHIMTHYQNAANDMAFINMYHSSEIWIDLLRWFSDRRIFEQDSVQITTKTFVGRSYFCKEVLELFYQSYKMARLHSVQLRYKGIQSSRNHANNRKVSTGNKLQNTIFESLKLRPFPGINTGKKSKITSFGILFVIFTSNYSIQYWNCLWS